MNIGEEVINKLVALPKLECGINGGVCEIIKYM